MNKRFFVLSALLLGAPAFAASVASSKLGNQEPQITNGTKQDLFIRVGGFSADTSMHTYFDKNQKATDDGWMSIGKFSTRFVSGKPIEPPFGIEIATKPDAVAGSSFSFKILPGEYTSIRLNIKKSRDIRGGDKFVLEPKSDISNKKLKNIAKKYIEQVE